MFSMDYTLFVMRKILLKAGCLFAVLFPLSAVSGDTIEPDYFEAVAEIDFVNPFIGTGGHGHTFPGPTAPFGMVQLSPDTRLTGWDGCSGYHYSDNKIYGFSHTHLSGTGVSDYGDILIMPVNDNNYKDYSSEFDKNHETAGAGYYSVHLDKPDVEVALTTTYRTGVHNYIFENPKQPGFVIDMSHRDLLLDWRLTVVNDSTIEGYRISRAWAQEQHIYFVLRTNVPVKLNDKDSTIHHFVLKSDTDRFIMQVGISAVDIEGARKNLEAEHNGWDFAEYVQELREIWSKQLSKITVEGGSHESKTKFYTALYHTMIAPNLYSDVDGRYRGTDLKVHQTDPNRPHYTVFSLWDTFRSAHPLLTIIEPERTQYFIESMYRHYRDGGKLPMWELACNYTGCMIGFHALSVIADAFSKGLISEHQMQLYKEPMLDMFRKDELGVPEFLQHGYIPGNKEAESVSKTLEYAYNSWCIATSFSDDKTIADRFYRLAKTYQNLYNPSNGFMTPRVNGNWIDTFDPYEVNFHYTEANAWQYSFFVPHDINGLIKLHGGYESFESDLDALFNAKSSLSGRKQPDISGMIGQYSHGNEPDHHVPFLYYYIGKPHKTQDLVNGILDTLYTDRPDGISGNEDCGQMSAWYVLSAMGLYPALPGSDEMLIVNPAFNVVKISDDFNPRFTIRRKGEGAYISSVNVDGNETNLPILNYQTRSEAMTIDIVSSDTPPTFPKIFSVGMNAETPLVSNPTIRFKGSSFRKRAKIPLTHPSQNANIYYTLDGSVPNTNSKAYKNPIKIKRPTTIKTIACDSIGNCSFIEEAQFYKQDNRFSIELFSEYSNQYPANGDQALIDGVHGGSDFRTGGWQGYYNTDFKATLDLGKKRKFQSVEIGFLEDIRSWIWRPTQIYIEVSNDGVNYDSVQTINLSDTSTFGEVELVQVSIENLQLKSRYIRITAKNKGTNPPWHPSPGKPTWLFLDEISIKR